MANPVTQAMLERRYPPLTVRRTFSDDGTGVAGERLQTALDEAYDVVDMRLRKVWGTDGIEALVSGSEALTGVVCRIAMALGAGGRLEYRTEDKSPLDAEIQSALKTVDQITRADLRPSSESAAGANPMYSDRTNAPEEPQFVFAPSRGRPAPGGY
jgi:hypothetical protein